MAGAPLALTPGLLDSLGAHKFPICPFGSNLTLHTPDSNWVPATASLPVNYSIAFYMLDHCQPRTPTVNSIPAPHRKSVTYDGCLVSVRWMDGHLSTSNTVCPTPNLILLQCSLPQVNRFIFPKESPTEILNAILNTPSLSCFEYRPNPAQGGLEYPSYLCSLLPLPQS